MIYKKLNKNLESYGAAKGVVYHDSQFKNKKVVSQVDYFSYDDIVESINTTKPLNSYVDIETYNLLVDKLQTLATTLDKLTQQVDVNTSKLDNLSYNFVEQMITSTSQGLIDVDALKIVSLSPSSSVLNSLFFKDGRAFLCDKDGLPLANVNVKLILREVLVPKVIPPKSQKTLLSLFKN